MADERFDPSKVREVLRERERSASWLARRAGMSEATINRLLNEHRKPSVRTVDRLEDALQLERGALRRMEEVV